ncbi:unnamed protein product, partial [Oppiella nova]
DIYTERAVDIIRERANSSSKPLFLYLSHQSVHSASRRQPLQVPQDLINRHRDVQDLDRRTFVGMVSALDDSVGEVMAALKMADILNNTIVVFTTDNGGSTRGTAPGSSIDYSVGSNWPLRGWGDVSFHGSQQAQTPNIDLLASTGIILNNYYTSPLCSPSRSAILTGYHPIHTGTKHDGFQGAQPFGTPLQYKLLPQYLKELGYETHAVGKWHQGFHRREYLPTRRGFDSHFGDWTGQSDYYDRTSAENWWAMDFRNGELPANTTEYEGRYATDIYTERAVDIIRERANSSSKP